MKSTNASTANKTNRKSNVKKNNNTPQAPARPNQEGVDAELKSRTTDGADIETVNIKDVKARHKTERSALKILMEEEFRLKPALLKCLEYAAKVNFALIHLIKVENGEIVGFGDVIELLKLYKPFKNQFDKDKFFAPVAVYPAKDKDGNEIMKKAGTGKKFELKENAEAVKEQFLKDFKKANRTAETRYPEAIVKTMVADVKEDSYKDKFTPLLIQRTLQNLELRAIKANNARTNTRLDLRTANVAQIFRLITAG